MWTATIESKATSKGVLNVGVSYTDGSEVFSESCQVISVDDLNNQIVSRLGQLERLSLVSIQLGPFDKSKVPSFTPDPKQVALGTLRDVQDLVKLGVLDETDTKVADAVKAVKDLL